MSPHDFLSEFPVVDRPIFLNHASVAPLPLRSARALERWLKQARCSVGTDWPQWAAASRKARANAATMLGCDRSEVAFVHNTTHGLLIVANSLTWRPGDNVVICEHEFPANIYPWKNLAARGVAMRQVPERNGRFEFDEIVSRIDERTRLLSVSMVQYSTGFRLPMARLGEFCRDRGVLFCVDGIQALGAMPVDVRKIGCDFFSSCGHKWLLGAEGFGVLFVRREAMEKMNDSMTGWVGRVKSSDYDDTDQPLSESARRFEEGGLAMALAVIFEKSTELLLEVGAEEVWRRIEALTERIVEGVRGLGLEVISPRGEGETSGIVAFAHVGADMALWHAELEKREIIMTCRRGWLRASPHFYNQPEQVDALIEALREIRAMSL